MNLLVTTLGASWAVVPELLGFTNPDQYAFFRNHSEHELIRQWRIDYSIKPVDACLIITTNGQIVLNTILELKDWLRLSPDLPPVHFFSYHTLNELNTLEEMEQMTDLVYRVVMKAKAMAGTGDVYLSLAGGRKNMSADIQQAGEIFGCSALIHVVDKGNLPEILRKPKGNELLDPPVKEAADQIIPLVIRGRMEANPILSVSNHIDYEKFPVKPGMQNPPSTELAREIRFRLKQSGNLLFNAYKDRTSEDFSSPFDALHQLAPNRIESLKNEFIGRYPEIKPIDIEWLKALPKAELHCHFGGILSPTEMIEVAMSYQNEIRKLSNQPEYAGWINPLKKAVTDGDIDVIHQLVSIENLASQSLNFTRDIHLQVAAFLICFEKDPELLKQFIYGKYADPKAFCQIGINRYEALGNLQGSKLLQTEAAIRRACRILVKQCIEQNIVYHEIRCSPVKYILGGLQADQVFHIMRQELKSEFTRFRILFIASRHGQMSDICRHIELAEAITENEEFARDFAGFDLAGAEFVRKPSEMRSVFMPMMKRCIPITIHAGEDEPVGNIWEAVYHLNADRIGHGLTLKDDPSLLIRFRDRKIAIELCPSSNYQIVGFKDYHLQGCVSDRAYPLKEYMRQGLKVTLNTDDPGISMTDLTHEYYKAACMNEGGLSKWDILKLVKNGFQAAFLPLDQKKSVILEAENKIIQLLNQETC